MSDRETDLEALELCQFEPEVYRAMSVHNCQRQCHKTTTVEVKKDSTVLTGGTLHGTVLTLQSTTEVSPVSTVESFFTSRVIAFWHCL